MNNVVVLIGRILLAAIFILAGFGKLSDINGTVGYFSMYNIPGGMVTAVGVGLVEFLGGLGILVGFQTRIVAWVMAVFSVATALVAHMNWADMMQLINFQKNLAIAGGFLVLATYGPGALSVDARRGVEFATA